MVYYLGHYSCEVIAEDKRTASPPAMNKMGYIISVMEEALAGEAVVVSPCETSLPHLVRGGLYPLNGRVSLKTFDSIGGKFKLLRGLGHLLTRRQTERYLLSHVKAEDTVLVYHSLALMDTVERLKRKTGCTLVIEVEELYSDVKENDELRKRETEYLKIADEYVFITELLQKEVDGQGKPSTVLHGTYRTVPRCGERCGDGRIHVVYAGSFNPVKGGAICAIEAAEHLDDRYVLHVLGKGKDSDTQRVKEAIERIAPRTECRILFEGYKTGEEFDSLVQSCHIGLSTQQPDGKYNASSFPSKVLMYMSNGLPVVSVRIPAVATSRVGEYIYYYDTPTPQNIAEAIRSVPVEQYTDELIRSRLAELDRIFTAELGELLARGRAEGET